MERQNIDNMKDQLKADLIKSGEIDKLKLLLKKRLSESGWSDEMKSICKEAIRDMGIEKVTFESLVGAITSKGREAVPDEVKKELLEEIKKAANKRSSS